MSKNVRIQSLATRRRRGQTWWPATKEQRRPDVCQICADGHKLFINNEGDRRHSLPEPAGDMVCAVPKND